MLDFAKKMLEKLLISAFSSPLKEISFKFNDKHYRKAHEIAMGRKMAVAFAVIFMAHIENVMSKYENDIYMKWMADETHW